MGSNAFGLPWRQRQLISDSNGYTGQGPLMDLPPEPQLSAPVGLGEIPNQLPSGVARPRLDAATSPTIRAAEGVLQGLPQSPSAEIQGLAQKPPSTTRAILATLANTFTPSAGFAGLIAYGPKGLAARKQMEQYQAAMPTRLSAAKTMQDAWDDDALRVGQDESRQIREQQIRDQAAANRRTTYSTQTNNAQTRGGIQIGPGEQIPSGYTARMVTNPEGQQEMWAIPNAAEVARQKRSVSLVPTPPEIKKAFNLQQDEMPETELGRYQGLLAAQQRAKEAQQAAEERLDKQIAATDARSEAGRNLQRELSRVRAAKSGASDSDQDLVEAVIASPSILSTLTPTARTRITPLLQKQGFRDFGKDLSDTALGKLSDSRFALASVQDLRDLLVENKDQLGPTSAISVLNPYSEKRRLQADINRVKQRVGKALEGGVLRKEDEEKYKQILATISDTDETAIYKMDGLIKDLETDMGIYLKTLGEGGRRVGALNTGQGPAPQAIEQTNIKTQAKRHSFDGGKTWRTGPLPSK